MSGFDAALMRDVVMVSRHNLLPYSIGGIVLHHCQWGTGVDSYGCVETHCGSHWHIASHSTAREEYIIQTLCVHKHTYMYVCTCTHTHTHTHAYTLTSAHHGLSRGGKYSDDIICRHSGSAPKQRRYVCSNWSKTSEVQCIASFPLSTPQFVLYCKVYVHGLGTRL